MLFDIRRLKSFIRNLITLAVVLSIAGCFHDDGATPPGDPTGYYTGTITTNSYTDSSIQAIYHNKRLMLISNNEPNETYLYDMSISETGASFTGNSVNYINGVKEASGSTVSGSINAGAEIRGDLSGAGIGQGSFTLTYAISNNNDESDIARFASTVINGMVGDKTEDVVDSTSKIVFAIDAGGVISTSINATASTFEECTYEGSISNVAGTNLYSINLTTTASCVNGGPRNGVYTGLAASEDPYTSLLILASDVTNGFSVNWNFTK